ncbi:MAG TPA: hypothetical protein VM884_05795 [Flavisolibacter sp.]|jgi:hypothetical protein|nr:hypothetical protein [Flavisolibacter sp.]
MKRRYRYLLNIFSVSLLLAALYLNFVKKETADVSIPVIDTDTAATTDGNSKGSKIASATQSGHTIVLK